ncbi:MAG: hypothetical protein AB7N54_00165 [Alphaproteobacteria bacterium]
MAFAGSGLLALWNGFDPARRAEYDLWHTREHLPERLAVPGFLVARRYVDGAGPLPAWLTLYEVETPAVLMSQPYLRLLDNPTAWSRGMRGSFRDFLRLGCRVASTRGGGIGGALLAATLASGDLPPEAGGMEGLAALLGLPAVTAVHLAVVDPSVAAVPFAAGPARPAIAAAAALFVEGFDRAALAAAEGEIAAVLAAAGMARPPVWTSYTLAYALDRAALGAVATYVPPAP